MQHDSTHYLGWFDDSKKSQMDKILEAMTVYEDRFQQHPNVVLVSPACCVDMPEVRVIVHPVIAVRPNHFLVGWEELSI